VIRQLTPLTPLFFSFHSQIVHMELRLHNHAFRKDRRLESVDPPYLLEVHRRVEGRRVGLLYVKLIQISALSPIRVTVYL
jgi:hypothetical protein